MIPIVGVQKTSLIDYPQKISTILFTPGCNFRCPYCHNPQLVIGIPELEPIPLELIYEHLKLRRKLLDGVVISGGEPTLHGENLIVLLQEIKKLGYLIKLDTNGTNPALLQRLIEKQLVDYVAMDLKTSLEHYPALAGVAVDPEALRVSIALLLQSDARHSLEVEFRTTLHPRLHTVERFLDMVSLIAGAPLYVLQTFRPAITLAADYAESHPFTENQMHNFVTLAKEHVQECVLR